MLRYSVIFKHVKESCFAGIIQPQEHNTGGLAREPEVPQHIPEPAQTLNPKP